MFSDRHRQNLSLSFLSHSSRSLPAPALFWSWCVCRTAKGGLHSTRRTWCALGLVSRARIAMWLIWDTIIALLQPLTALIGAGGAGTITLDNGTR